MSERAVPSAELLLNNLDWLQGLSRALVSDPHRAEDAAQRAALAALGSRPHRQGAARGWLAAILRNELRQDARATLRRERRESHAARSGEVPATEEVAARLSVQRRIVELVDELEEPFRTAIALRYLDDLPPREVARRLGVPVKTVSSRIERGLARLRGRLDRSSGGDRTTWLSALAGGAVTRGGIALGGPLLALSAKGVLAALAATIAVGLALWLAGLERGDPVPPDADGGGTAPGPPAELASGFEPRGAGSPAVGGHRAALAGTVAGPIERRGEAPATAVTALLVDGGGEPLPRGFASAPGLEGSPTAAASASGRVELLLSPELLVSTDDAEGVRIALEFSAPGAATSTGTYRLLAGQVNHLGSIELAPAGALEGRVVDPGGEPVAGASLWVQPLPSWPLASESVEAARCRGLRFYSRTWPSSGRTLADGSFLLEGVEAGHARVWAHAPGSLHACSPELAIPAAGLVRVPDLLLEPLDPGLTISGRVLDPLGAPVSGARLDDGSPDPQEQSCTPETDDRGEFEFELGERRSVRLVVSDPEQRWASTTVEGVQPGTRDLEIRLPAWPALELTAVDAQGAPIGSYAVRWVDPERQRDLFPPEEVEGVAGPLRLRIPEQPFEIQVLGGAWRTARLGPFDPGRAPEQLVATLEPCPGLRGRVTYRGEPVVGAEVRALRALPAGHWKGSLPMAVGGDELQRRVVSRHTPHRVRTDEDGRFHVAFGDWPRVLLRVDKPGRASALIGPVEVDRELGAGGIQIDIGVGGVLEGTVLVPASQSPAGRLVIASRGDGFCRWRHTDEAGRYHFEALGAGPWQVVVATDNEDPISRGSSEYLGHPLSDDPFDCRVREGGVTRFDIDLRPFLAGELRGQLEIDGGSPGPWEVDLWNLSEFMPRALEADGSFRFAAPLGPVELELDRRTPDGAHLFLRQRIEIAPGRNTWSARFDTGHVRGTLEPGAYLSEDGRPAVLLLVWLWPSGLRARARVKPDARGGFALEAVPAGPCRLVVAPPFSVDRGDASTWPVLRELVVRPGETTMIELP